MSTQEKTPEQERQEIAISYAQDLEAIAEGKLFKDNNGEFYILPDDAATPTDEDGNEEDPVTIYDYMERHHLGDERYEINSRGDFCGGRILVGFGGPNVWISDTQVEVYWSGQATERLFDDAADMVREYLEENYNALREAR